ncbi:MAG: undecaprenyl-phosphate glucose phosphotransferase [Candidatus Latescibacter sp.]|nr:undecaprenyl-phosphate glucose phosphotransferase [Candidatus Latescibacter sp.]
MKLRYHEPTMITLFRFGDAFLAGATLYFILILFGQSGGQAFEVSLVLALLTLVVFTYTGVYRSWRTSALQEEIKRILKSCIYVYLAYFILIFFMKLYYFHPRIGVLVWMCLWPLILFFERLTVRSVLWHYRERGRNIRTAVIVGTGMLGVNLARWINENPWSGTKILGFFNGFGETEIEGYPLLGSYKELSDFVRNNNVDSVYIALPMNHAKKMKQLVDALCDTTTSIHFLPDVFFYDFMRGSCVQYINNMPVISLVDSPMQGFNALQKRVEDVIIASLVLIFISPLLLVIAILIKFTSEGPVIFKQWRYGLDGKPILVWKFRTMTVCEDGYQMNHTIPNDTRLTKIGKLLRRFSMDEFPQFINVLFGNMSIVGPRPHAISQVEEYRKIVTGSMLRHKIKPGITGLAQLYATRGVVDTVEKQKKRVEYDLEYLQKWTIVLDLKIILYTIFNLIRFNREVH